MRFLQAWSHPMPLSSSLSSTPSDPAALLSPDERGQWEVCSPRDSQLDKGDDQLVYAARKRKLMSALPALINRNQGLLFALVAQFLYSTMSLFFKLLTSYSRLNRQPVPTLQIIFIRMVITWTTCVLYMIFNKVPDPLLGPRPVRFLLLCRGSVGFCSLFGVYYSIDKLGLADSTILTFLTPVTTALLSWLFLGEGVTLAESLAGFVSLGGVLFIARPSLLSKQVFQAAVASRVSLHRKRAEKSLQESEMERLFAVFITIAAICAAGAAYTLIRKIGNRASAAHTVSYFAMISTLASPLVMYSQGESWVLPTQFVWILLLLLVGLFGLGAQVLVALALQREKASLVSSMIYSQIIWTTIFQTTVLEQPIEMLSLCGCALITSSAIFITISRSVGTKR